MNPNPSMRVLHVYRTYFPDPPGGLQEAIKQICLATSSFGVQTKVFTLSPDPSPKKVQIDNTEVTRSRSWAAPASCDLGGLDAFVQFSILVKWADVIHYHYPWPFADVLRLGVARSKPSVMTYHSDIVRQQFLGLIYAPLMRRTLEGMSVVVASSPAYITTSPVLSQYVEPQKLKVIPFGIEDYASDSASEGGDATILARIDLGNKPFILALGVLRYYKGLHTLIEASHEIDGLIVIAGSGPEELALKSLANRLSTKNVLFAGQVSTEEKKALLSTCLGLVLPSHIRSEAFGMVLVEAAMFSKPMVCCEVGSGTSFVNIHGETGFVVPPESPRDLAQACNSLFNDQTAALKMGVAARTRYEQMFSGNTLGRAYNDVYREAIDAQKSH